MSNFTGQPKFTSIVLTWSAPQEPNGVIISYEVTYRVSDGNLVTTNTTDLRFTISSLTPGTNVTEISVSAYTSMGRGDPVHIPHIVTLNAPREYIANNCTLSFLPKHVAKVMIRLEVLSATSVQVSLDQLDILELKRYIVYYSQTGNSEMTTKVPSSENSVTIDNLLTDVEYQFQVVAVAELDGDVVTGERSKVSIARPTPPPASTPITDETQGKISYIVIITFLLYRRCCPYCWRCCGVHHYCNCACYNIDGDVTIHKVRKYKEIIMAIMLHSEVETK